MTHPTIPSPDDRPVQLTLPTPRWQPAEIAAAVLALALVAYVPTVYSQRSQAAQAAALDARLPIARTAPLPGGAVVEGQTFASEVRVHVVGAVEEPGVISLSPASRIEDAIRLAGGALPEADLSQINLAERVSDGQQILVPRAGEVLPSTSPVRPANQNRIRLNGCTKEDLEVIPGIGPVLAEAIIEYRNAHGGFSSLDQLNEVPGIGARKIATIASYVTLD